MLVQELSELKQYLNKSNIHKIVPPILAIDYGAKNIGLAVSDTKGTVATPLTVLRNDDAFLENLKDILNEQKVKTIVLGIPQAFKTAHLQNIQRILKFQSLIQDFAKQEVFLYDETYSTSDSYTILRDLGKNQKKSKKEIDKIAAACFLQELIDFKNRQNE